MLTYPWKCTVLHCNHLGNTWKPLVLMTPHFDYCPSASEGDNQSVRSSAPVVSRCFPGGYNVKLYISRGRLAWWLLAFLYSVTVQTYKNYEYVVHLTGSLCHCSTILLVIISTLIVLCGSNVSVICHSYAILATYYAFILPEALMYEGLIRDTMLFVCHFACLAYISYCERNVCARHYAILHVRNHVIHALSRMEISGIQLHLGFNTPISFCI